MEMKYVWHRPTFKHHFNSQSLFEKQSIAVSLTFSIHCYFPFTFISVLSLETFQTNGVCNSSGIKLVGNIAFWMYCKLGKMRLLEIDTSTRVAAKALIMWT